MSQFAMIKLVIDIGLGASMLYLALRFLRGGISDRQAAQLASLDASLKALVREAEVVGNNLNDQLLRRQQALDGSLREVDSTETKLQRSLTGAKDLAATLDDQIKKIRDELLEVERRRVRLESVRESNPAREVHREQSAPIAPAREPAPVFKAAPIVETPQYEVIDDESDNTPSVEFSNVNIFGESIPESSTQQVVAAPENMRSALRQAVEKIVESKRVNTSALSRPALDAVYAAAEEMLKAGRNLEAVAARTKLPLDEVRTLSQKVIRDTIIQDSEPAPAPRAAADQRLGVLGGTRRTEQTA